MNMKEISIREMLENMFTKKPEMTLCYASGLIYVCCESIQTIRLRGMVCDE